ncbi:uncharacterized protein LOC132893628 [Neoarius graeffei]|uniref:uncharacterized protein LOC132893628 n=1 Tax=Neoarius graeffei TaxID=443677 RepID=UPI00298CE472|nr:uncharacterized protein LOC132893628 [Neoarius graeffei]
MGEASRKSSDSTSSMEDVSDRFRFFKVLLPPPDNIPSLGQQFSSPAAHSLRQILLPFPEFPNSLPELEANRKSFSMASPKTSHTRVFCFRLSRVAGKGGSLGVLILSKADRLKEERALAITSLNKCDVEVYAPGTGSKTKGVIYGVPTELSDEDILGKAKGAEVSEVKRFQITKDNMRVASQTVLLTFESESIPRRIEIGYLSFQVKPYIRPPLRCFNCHTYGHVAAVCRKKRKCGKCGGDHNYEDCASALCCPNCGEAHSAGFKGCRFYANAVEVQKIRTYERVSYAEAVKRVGHANRPSQQPARIFTPPSDSLIIKKTDFLAFITDVLTGLKFSKVVKKSDVIRIVSLSAAKYLQILNGRTICCGEKASLSNCSSMVSMEGCLAGLRISWKIELSR